MTSAIGDLFRVHSGTRRPRATSEFSIMLRTNADPAAVFAATRRTLGELDPTVPPKLSTLRDIFSESLNNRHFNLLLVGIFAITALLLAMAGVFGVLAYSVARRTREIGVRIALGATPGNVLGMVLRQGMTTVAAGTAVGLLGAFLLTRAMRSLLFEVSPADPATVAGGGLLLIFLALAGSFISARRATRADPPVAFWHE